MSAECPTCGRDDFANVRSMKIHHKRAHGESLAGVKLECENCGGDFRVKPAKEERSQYCSPECYHEDRSGLEERTCIMCSRQFMIEPYRPNERCCRSCTAETQHDRPRPDDIESLIWLLYRYEGFSIVETYRRQRAVLGIDECLTEDETREKIHDMGIAREYNSSRWTLQDLDPDAVGDPNPEGDESYKRYYQEA